MRGYKVTPELLAKIEKRKRFINIVFASFIAGHAYHTYGVVQLSRHHKEQRTLSEQRFELMKKKLNDKEWIEGLRSKLGSLRETRDHVNSLYFSQAEIKDLKGLDSSDSKDNSVTSSRLSSDKRGYELTKSKDTII